MSEWWDRPLQEIEDEAILRQVEKFAGQKAAMNKVSKALGMSTRTLYERVNRLKLIGKKVAE